jgi:superfamily II RNA helicase
VREGPVEDRLAASLPTDGKIDPDEALERFLSWVDTTGLSLYPAQEEAVLELMAGRHVILNTPTGSGKSLVALALHFSTLCARGRSFYTSPIKALVNEKFFDLCEQLGPAQVGMMTGDASVNPRAPVVCCTAEVLANLAMREGEYAAIDTVVMDEFHYYSDPDRGMAWQAPLLTLPQARFLLMSATLGDVSVFEQRIAEFTGTEVTRVFSSDRPVPLDFSYETTPIHDTIVNLVDQGRAPVYVVNFTQREAAEQAQGLTSFKLADKDKRAEIQREIGDMRFDTPFGRDMKRLLSHGIGLHHAGLLPKYRMLVERLAQKGLLSVISGTDTLGVGVNVPIRTVLFSKLCKFDGLKVRVLSVREFQQIAGRAGRKGYDDAGSVVAQAPDHVIENLKLEAKARGAGKKKFNRKKPPERGYVPWDESTFNRLRDGQPEALDSQFEVTHGMLLGVLDREFNVSAPHGGYRRLIDMIGRSYERDGARRRHRRHCAELFRSLRHAGVLEVGRPEGWPRACVRVSPGLQRDFSLNHTLSLYLVAALEQLDHESPTYALDVVSVVEAILESPRAVVQKLLDHAKTELVGRLKADGVEYEERMAQLERIDIPKPGAEFIYRTFDDFRVHHPWVRSDNVRPKSIARDMFERWATFNDYVREYGLARSEGVLLRYLSQAYKTLVQNVPVSQRDDEFVDLLAFLRATLARVDSSLVSEWERMLRGDPEGTPEVDAPAPPPYDLAADPKALGARVRAELLAVTKALAAGDFVEALGGLRHDPEDEWTPERLEAALQPVLDEIERIEFGPSARYAQLTTVRPESERMFTAQHVLVGPDGNSPWFLEAQVDLREPEAVDGPLLYLRRIAS